MKEGTKIHTHAAFAALALTATIACGGEAEPQEERDAAESAIVFHATERSPLLPFGTEAIGTYDFHDTMTGTAARVEILNVGQRKLLFSAEVAKHQQATLHLEESHAMTVDEAAELAKLGLFPGGVKPDAAVGEARIASGERCFVVIQKGIVGDETTPADPDGIYFAARPPPRDGFWEEAVDIAWSTVVQPCRYALFRSRGVRVQ